MTAPSPAHTIDGLRAHIEQLSAITADLAEAAAAAPALSRIEAQLRDEVRTLSDLADGLADGLAEHQELADRLAWQATHDALTGLHNRAFLVAALDSALAASRRSGLLVAVLFIDLDGFKAINDVHGHATGDVVLVEVARRIEGTVRSDAVVSRLGGDEFVVLVDQLADLGEAVRLGQRIIDEVEVPITFPDGRSLSLSASVGVSAAVGEADQALEVLRDADVAVYRAKGHGRGRVEVFDEALQTLITERTDTEAALRMALGAGELLLEYQPVLDLGTGAVHHLEALVRWDRPGMGRVGPAEFIPIAEASGLIVDVSRWVLVRACRQLAAWQNDPMMAGVPVAVNVSGRHITRGELVADVRAALAATRAPGHLLELELTERQVLEDPAAAATCLRGLAELGVRLCVDDFGTGHASVTWLRDLPLSALKIDGSFIRSMASSPADRTLVGLMASIGAALQLEVVAEGVESADQLDIVAALGLELVQGYHLAMPMHATELVRWCSAREISHTPS